MLELRGMTDADLPLVAAWLREPHVARWWLAGTTLDAELDQCRERLAGSGDTATTLLIVTDDRTPIGWCQWYRWDDYPAEAEAVGAEAGEVGIDYAIGSPAAVGRGLGRQLVGALVREVRRHHPGAGVLVDPEAGNAASRRVLEVNGFELVAVRRVVSEPNDEPMAIYRLSGRATPDGGARTAVVVDAANVVGSRPDGWWRDRPAAARRLVDEVRTAVAAGRLRGPVVVVLEGAARSGVEEGATGGIRILHAARSADDALVDLVGARQPAPTLVVTADRELRRRVEAAGASTVGPDWLLGRLGASGR